jgi:hypothetical protein
LKEKFESQREKLRNPLAESVQQPGNLQRPKVSNERSKTPENKAIESFIDRYSRARRERSRIKELSQEPHPLVTKPLQAFSKYVKPEKKSGKSKYLMNDLEHMPTLKQLRE